MWASRLSISVAVVIGLSILVLAVKACECFDHVSDKHKSRTADDESDYVDGLPRSHRSRSHSVEEWDAYFGEHGLGGRRHVTTPQTRVVPYRNASKLIGAKILKGSDLKEYMKTDKEEFQKILESSKRERSERKRENDTESVTKEKEVRKKDDCDGYTCKFKHSCGAAPLNKLSARVDSGDGQKKKIVDLMINGEPQIYGEWPSYVRLETRWGYQMISICGGTIISDRHILTAAHCMYDPDKGVQRVKIANIKVILGENQIGKPDHQERILGVTEICVSRRYEEAVSKIETELNDYTDKEIESELESETDVDGENEQGKEEKKENVDGTAEANDKTEEKKNVEEGTAKYDFAVMTLNETINFTDYHQPSCLPEGKFSLNRTSYDQDPPCYLVGSGVTGFDKGLRRKMSKTVEKMRMERASCKAFGFGRRDESRECYTKKDLPGDSCAGDSGGPILCLDEQEKRWSVVSLVSYGSSDCSGKGSIGWVGVYTRVSNLSPIIKNQCGI